MDNFFSVLLIPQKDDKTYLSNIINNLGKDYDAPIFIPHLTLFGGIAIDFNKLKPIIDDVFKNAKPFTIKKLRINQSEAFFKTVFIEFDLDEELKRLFTVLSEKTDKRALSTFKPHISLIYKHMLEEEKLKIIETLNIKNEFEIAKVVICAPKEGDHDFLDIEGWRVFYKKRLQE